MEFGYNDRKFLRSIHINPEATEEQTVVDSDMKDIKISGDIYFYPKANISIPLSVAKAIMIAYGEVTLETYRKYNAR